MQLTPKQTKKFDKKILQQILTKENAFITDLFSKLPVPKSARDTNSDSEEEMVTSNHNTNIHLQSNEHTRAKSLEELHKRLEQVRNKHKLNYKEKLLKKSIKNKIKKKNKLDVRNAKQKLIRAAKLTEKGEKKLNNTNTNTQNENSVNPNQPTFNKEGKIMFSKFDFSNVGNKKHKKDVKDPKKILENVKKQQQHLSKLEASGENEKAVEVKERTAWKSAIAKAEGQKIRDDPELLKKSVQKREQKKRKSKKKWEARVAGVQKAKDERQKKRTENIAKRKKDKKNHKLKIASKKGKIIAGF